VSCNTVGIDPSAPMDVCGAEGRGEEEGQKPFALSNATDKTICLHREAKCLLTDGAGIRSHVQEGGWPPSGRLEE